jgi:hypothetical protein
VTKQAPAEIVGKDDPRQGPRIVTRDRAEIERQFAALLEAVPDAVDDDGFGIQQALIEAETWEDLNKESKLPDAPSQAGKHLKVFSIAKRRSEIAEGLPYYLIVESVNTANGEAIRWQTSAASVAIVLVKLHSFGKLPALIRIDKAEKPTKAGFYPCNVTVLGVDA